ncbi:hypothetical protein E4U55_000880, partial [Claviceps digitariae]
LDGADEGGYEDGDGAEDDLVVETSTRPPPRSTDTRVPLPRLGSQTVGRDPPVALCPPPPLGK